MVDEVDEKVRCFGGGIWPPKLAPEACPREWLPRGPLPGCGRAVRARVANRIWGGGGFNVVRPKKNTLNKPRNGPRRVFRLARKPFKTISNYWF